MALILVIDDERAIRNSLKDILEYEKHTVTLAENGLVGKEKIEAEKPELILCDIKMPEMDGMEVLDFLKDTHPDVPVIMISGHGDIDIAVEAIKKGAYDFIQKPVDLNRLLVSVKNGLEKNDLVSETKALRKKVNLGNKMVGESDSLEPIKAMIEKVSGTDARVLITGENGTGKEVVAKLLHEYSTRKKESFVEVNCAAIPSELIESELFGHEKGAFTSAIKQRKGKFEQADGGTIFLDEIGDMSLSAQAKVLRALQENTITRVGSDKNIKVNVRVLAATNKNMKDEIAKGTFREDLYHRLSVILINVPPLRERKSDIPLLVDHFNNLIATETGTVPRNFADDAIVALKELQWTGNIRELRNVIERLLILCPNTIEASDVKLYASPIG